MKTEVRGKRKQFKQVYMEKVSENRKIGLAFGVMSDPINKQLTTQCFKFNKKKVEVFEKEIESINRLRIRSGLLTDSMVNKIVSKLYKKIVQHVAKENGFSILGK